MSYFVETDVFDKLRQQNEGGGVNGYLNNGKKLQKWYHTASQPGTHRSNLNNIIVSQ